MVHSRRMELNNRPGYVNASKLCRLCAVQNEHLIPIFEGNGLEQDLQMKLQMYLSIEVTEDDLLPRQICHRCAYTLLAWHELFLGSRAATKRLQSMLIAKPLALGDNSETEGQDVQTLQEAINIPCPITQSQNSNAASYNPKKRLLLRAAYNAYMQAMLDQGVLSLVEPEALDQRAEGDDPKDDDSTEDDPKDDDSTEDDPKDDDSTKDDPKRNDLKEDNSKTNDLEEDNSKTNDLEEDNSKTNDLEEDNSKTNDLEEDNSKTNDLKEEAPYLSTNEKQNQNGGDVLKVPESDMEIKGNATKVTERNMEMPLCVLEMPKHVMEIPERLPLNSVPVAHNFLIENKRSQELVANQHVILTNSGPSSTDASKLISILEGMFIRSSGFIERCIDKAVKKAIHRHSTVTGAIDLVTDLGINCSRTLSPALNPAPTADVSETSMELEAFTADIAPYPPATEVLPQELQGKRKYGTKACFQIPATNAEIKSEVPVLEAVESLTQLEETQEVPEVSPETLNGTSEDEREQYPEHPQTAVTTTESKMDSNIPVGESVTQKTHRATEVSPETPNKRSEGERKEHSEHGQTMSLEAEAEIPVVEPVEVLQQLQKKQEVPEVSPEALDGMFEGERKQSPDHPLTSVTTTEPEGGTEFPLEVVEVLLQLKKKQGASEVSPEALNRISEGKRKQYPDKSQSVVTTTEPEGQSNIPEVDAVEVLLQLQEKQGVPEVSPDALHGMSEGERKQHPDHLQTAVTTREVEDESDIPVGEAVEILLQLLKKQRLPEVSPETLNGRSEGETKDHPQTACSTAELGMESETRVVGPVERLLQLHATPVTQVTDVITKSNGRTRKSPTKWRNTLVPTSTKTVPLRVLKSPTRHQKPETSPLASQALQSNAKGTSRKKSLRNIINTKAGKSSTHGGSSNVTVKRKGPAKPRNINKRKYAPFNKKSIDDILKFLLLDLIESSNFYGSSKNHKAEEFLSELLKYDASDNPTNEKVPCQTEICTAQTEHEDASPNQAGDAQSELLIKDGSSRSKEVKEAVKKHLTKHGNVPLKEVHKKQTKRSVERTDLSPKGHKERRRCSTKRTYSSRNVHKEQTKRLTKPTHSSPKENQKGQRKHSMKRTVSFSEDVDTAQKNRLRKYPDVSLKNVHKKRGIRVLERTGSSESDKAQGKRAMKPADSSTEEVDALKNHMTKHPDVSRKQDHKEERKVLTKRRDSSSKDVNKAQKNHVAMHRDISPKEIKKEQREHLLKHKDYSPNEVDKASVGRLSKPGSACANEVNAKKYCSTNHSESSSKDPGKASRERDMKHGDHSPKEVERPQKDRLTKRPDASPRESDKAPRDHFTKHIDISPKESDKAESARLTKRRDSSPKEVVKMPMKPSTGHTIVSQCKLGKVPFVRLLKLKDALPIEAEKTHTDRSPKHTDVSSKEVIKPHTYRSPKHIDAFSKKVTKTHTDRSPKYTDVSSKKIIKTHTDRSKEVLKTHTDRSPKHTAVSSKEVMKPRMDRSPKHTDASSKEIIKPHKDHSTSNTGSSQEIVKERSNCLTDDVDCFPKKIRKPQWNRLTDHSDDSEDGVDDAMTDRAAKIRDVLLRATGWAPVKRFTKRKNTCPKQFNKTKTERSRKSRVASLKTVHNAKRKCLTDHTDATRSDVCTTDRKRSTKSGDASQVKGDESQGKLFSKTKETSSKNGSKSRGGRFMEHSDADSNEACKTEKDDLIDPDDDDDSRNSVCDSGRNPLPEHRNTSSTDFCKTSRNLSTKLEKAPSNTCLKEVDKEHTDRLTDQGDASPTKTDIAQTDRRDESPAAVDKAQTDLLTGRRSSSLNEVDKSQLQDLAHHVDDTSMQVHNSQKDRLTKRADVSPQKVEDSEEVCLNENIYASSKEVQKSPEGEILTGDANASKEIFKAQGERVTKHPDASLNEFGVSLTECLTQDRDVFLREVLKALGKRVAELRNTCQKKRDKRESSTEHGHVSRKDLDKARRGRLTEHRDASPNDVRKSLTERLTEDRDGILSEVLEALGKRVTELSNTCQKKVDRTGSSIEHGHVSRKDIGKAWRERLTEHRDASPSELGKSLTDRLIEYTDASPNRTGKDQMNRWAGERGTSFSEILKALGKRAAELRDTRQKQYDKMPSLTECLNTFENDGDKAQRVRVTDHRHVCQKDADSVLWERRTERRDVSPEDVERSPRVRVTDHRHVSEEDVDSVLWERRTERRDVSSPKHLDKAHRKPSTEHRDGSPTDVDKAPRKRSTEHRDGSPSDDDETPRKRSAEHSYASQQLCCLPTPVKCSICQTRFSTKESLAAHLQNHSEDESLRKLFEFAESSFSDQELRGMFKPGPVKCFMCDGSFPTEGHLKVHLKSHPEEEKRENLTCKTCGVYFSGRIDFIIHSEQHVEEQMQAARQASKSRTNSSRKGQPVGRRPATRASTYYPSFLLKNESTTTRLAIQENEPPSFLPFSSSLMKNESTTARLVSEENVPPTLLSVASSLTKNESTTTWLATQENVPPSFLPFASSLLKNESTATHLASWESPRESSFPCDSHLENKESSAIRMAAQENTLSSAFLCDSILKKIQSTLKRHVTQENSTSSSFACDSSLERYEPSGEQLDAQENSPPQRHSCHRCKKTFKTRNSLLDHISGHMRLSPYMCGSCGKRFTMPSMLKEHGGSQNITRPSRCDRCGGCFQWNTNLMSHKLLHKHVTVPVRRPCARRAIRVKPKTEQYQCLECKEYYSSKILLQLHQMKMHQGEADLFLDSGDCEQPAQADPDMKTDKVQLKTVEPSKIPCNTEMVFSRSDCSKVFASRTKLNAHQAAHRLERPFSCPVCDRHYKREIHRNVHLRKHTGEKPYSCDVCKSKFPRKKMLRKHRSSHAKPRLLLCSACGRQFKNEIVYSRHMLSHSCLEKSDESVKPHIYESSSDSESRSASDYMPESQSESERRFSSGSESESDSESDSQFENGSDNRSGVSSVNKRTQMYKAHTQNEVQMEVETEAKTGIPVRFGNETQIGIQPANHQGQAEYEDSKSLFLLKPLIPELELY